MTGVTEERRWPGLAGEAAGPGHKPHGNPASHSAAERVVTSVKAVIRLLGTNLPQKSRGGGENLTSAILGKTLQGGNGGQGRTSLLWEAGSSALCVLSLHDTRCPSDQTLPVHPSSAQQSIPVPSSELEPVPPLAVRGGGHRARSKPQQERTSRPRCDKPRCSFIAVR